ncbi:MAG: thiamine transport system substrate-binding protein [Chloroflexota bacterium]|nr:thiamine transport system substrate-binding protein [Chloroflexota bacterium]
MKRTLVLTLLVLAFALGACQTGPATLTVMTHDSFAVSDDVIAQFEQENNVKVNFLLSGDAGSTLNRAVLSKDAPVADVLYGVDNTFLSRALSEDIFESYASPLLDQIPDSLKLDDQDRALPVDYGDVCINYDKAYFADNGLALPASLEDLTQPQYDGLLVVENPAVSSTGLSFMFATIAQYGDGYLDYWQRLKDNDVVVVNDWETAYYTNFSGSSGQGAQPLVVSYGTSPAVEVVYAEEPLDEAPTASLVGDNMCFRQIEFVGILQGTQQRALAEKFVDFMLDVNFQEDIPLNMFVFPANTNAQLPEEFYLYNQQPENPASLPMDEIEANREAWITGWRELMAQ